MNPGLRVYHLNQEGSEVHALLLSRLNCAPVSSVVVCACSR